MERENHRNTVDLLDELIMALRRQAFALFIAAEEAHEFDLKSMFRSYSHERTQWISDLEKEVRKLGKVPSKFTETPNITIGKDEVIVQGCADTENKLLNTYINALQTGLIGNIRFLVTAQLEKIRETYGRLKNLHTAPMEQQEAI